MAFEKLSEKKQIATNLGTYISSLSNLLYQNRERKNLEDERKFSESVLNDNLDLDQQLNYRERQLKKISKTDRSEIKRIKEEISNLKDQIEQKKFSDDYLEQLTNQNAGVQSTETTINWLNKTLLKTTDIAIKSNIKTELNKLKTNLYEQKKSIIASNTTYAVNSRGIEVIDKQIKKVNDSRVEALDSGNNDYVSILDLQLQSLQKAKAETQISNVLTQLSVSTVSGNSALGLLNEFNKQIENADINTPINIGNARYESAKEFWETKRGDYLSDRSGEGFFSRYDIELSDKLVYKSTKNILNNDSFEDVTKWYDNLKERPEMQTYIDKIDQDKQKSLKTTADLRSNDILNQFAIKSDVKKALSELAFIQDTYGVNQSLNYQKIVSSAAQEKQNQINDILSTMSSILAENQGMSNQAAMDLAIKSGAGAFVSAEELATNKASDIITGLSDKATEQQFGEEDKLSIDKGTAPKFEAPSLSEGELYKAPNDKTVYKYENGSLRPFSGAWTEEQLKEYTGKGFSSINEMNSIDGLTKGSPIVTNDIETIKPIEQPGQKIFSPELLKYYKPEEIITKGQDKFLKQGVKQVWGEKLTGESFQELQTKYNPAEVEKRIVRAGKDIYLKSE